MAPRANDLIMEKLGELSAGQKATQEQILTLRKELFGNGQPGAIGRLFELHLASEKRIGALERWQSRALGIWAGASAAVSATVSGALMYFSHKSN